MSITEIRSGVAQCCCVRAAGPLMAAITFITYSTSAFADDYESLAEIVVTATKQAEPLQQVPISITALSGEELEHRGVENLVDYARSIPNLSFTDLGDGRERVAIRGIDSKTGSTVVGYYLDETPIPDSSSVSAEKVAFDPELVDVDRVEVLRGPQGTVFGAGSMGGTIRIIPKEPDAGAYHGYLKSNVESIDGSNEPSYGFNGMVNVPLISNVLALRATAWVRSDAGFITRSAASPASLMANTATGGPLDFQPRAKVPDGTSFGSRIAMRFSPTEQIAIEGSIFFDSQFFQGFQDITTGATNPSDARVQDFLFDQEENNRNRLTMSNLKLTVDFGFADFLTSLSYTRRLLSLEEEAAAALVSVGLGPPFSAAPITEEGRDDSVTAEIRLSSRTTPDGSDALRWLIGLYSNYQKGWLNIDWRVPGFSEHVLPTLGDNLYSQRGLDWTRQNAVFGEIAYTLLEHLKFTAGARAFRITDASNAPSTGLFADGSDASIPNPYIGGNTEGRSQSAVYKGGVAWQQTEDVLFYTQASEGFRSGFGRGALPTACDAEATQLGANPGQAQVAPDRLWNYELGIKSDWLNHRLRINAAAYRINWTSIQQQVFLNCGFALLENLGSVRNQGGELEVEIRPFPAMIAGVSSGYVHSALQQDIYGIPGTDGKPLPDVPAVTAGAFTSYDFPVFAEWHATARSDYSYTDRSLSTYIAGGPFTPDKRALSLLNLRLTLAKDHCEFSLYANNVLNDVERTALERDVSLNVTGRLRYSINTPRLIGAAAGYRF